jgi:acetylornithine deacetylase/succinyl-diaminopimelate desuccinylase-like protein
VAAGFWIFSVYGTGPAPLPADAPAGVFSAARADALLARLLGPERPRPTGSPEAAAFRKRLEAELDRIGVPYREQTQQSCYGRRHWRACATVTNIYAHAVPGTGREVLLVAHTDSVPRGPGAADDGSGVAVILETLRALKARHLSGNRPVAALFTDGEEKGLLGAAAYVRDPAAKARTGAVVNVEARGNRGASLLFQTSPGDAALIDL